MTSSREKFLTLNPYCAFCGGSVLATTIEHCPPKALFQRKMWPVGFMFPACESCNHGSSDQDVLIAMLGRIDPVDDAVGNGDGRVAGLIKNANAQHPGMARKMLPTAIKARRRNRAMGIVPGPGQTHQDVAPMTVPDELHEAVCVFAAKLAKAIYFHHAKAIFPSEGTLILNWFTNVELVRHGKYPLFDLFAELRGSALPLHSGGKSLDDQFQYKLSISSDRGVFVLLASFGTGFGLVLFGAVEPGLIESTVGQLKEKYGKESPFTVLQSTSLPVGAGTHQGAPRQRTTPN